MNPLTFTCSLCQNVVGVAPEYAGMPVTCPHCRQVVMAPAVTRAADSNIHSGWSPAARNTEDLSAGHRKAMEREDSIFSDPDEGDDEALFGLHPSRKNAVVELPPASFRNTPHDLTQPTQRVPGLAPSRTQTPPQPVRSLPVPPPDEQPFATSLNMYPSPPKGTVDAVGPFVMEAALPSEFSSPELEISSPTTSRRKPAADSAPNWKLWSIIGLAAYSFMMTVVAVWGWTRSPAAATAPVKHDAPAPPKAKMR